MSEQEIFNFDSFCPECQETKPVQAGKTALKTAIASDQNIRVGSNLCGHIWDLAPSERGKLRNLLPRLSG
jgi:hypothetical protein